MYNLEFKKKICTILSKAKIYISFLIQIFPSFYKEKERAYSYISAIFDFQVVMSLKRKECIILVRLIRVH